MGIFMAIHLLLSRAPPTLVCVRITGRLLKRRLLAPTLRVSVSVAVGEGHKCTLLMSFQVMWKLPIKAPHFGTHCCEIMVLN